jgi:hypothetical protein
MISLTHLFFGSLFIFYMIPIMSYVFNKFKLNIPDPNNKEKFRKLLNDYDGLDQRYTYDNKFNYTTIYSEDLTEINRIRLNFVKFNLLNEISSDKLNSFDKINLIKTSKLDSLDHLSDQIKPSNIIAGGLFNDWIE